MTKKKALSTSELLEILHSTHSVAQLNEYTSKISDHIECQTFHEYLGHMIQIHCITESELVRASQLHRTYAYQILNGSKNPGRDKVLALCLAAQLNYQDAQRALTLAGLGQLYPRRKRDSILIFALEQHLDVQQTNELLFVEEEPTLE